MLVRLAVLLGLVLVLTTSCGVIPTGPSSRDSWADVPGLPPIVAIDAAGQHSLALAADGRVFSWGDTEGGLGGPAPDTDCDNRSPAGFAPCRPTPAVVPLPGPAVAISSADDHQAALTADGAVYEWGSDHDPRHTAPGGCRSLAQVPPPCHLTPVRVTGLPPVVGISAGVSHTVAVDRDGRVWQWGEVPPQLATATCSGRPSYGRDYACSPDPVVVRGLPPVATVVANHSSTTFAVDRDGGVWQWSGATPFAGNPAEPTRLAVPDAVVAMASGRNGEVMFGRDGSVWVRGTFEGLPAGDCGQACTRTPVQELPAGSAVSTTGPAGIRVRTADGTVLIRDREGLTPGEDSYARWTAIPDLAGAAMVAHGNQHLLLLTPDGRVRAMGYNALGQLGV
ncbi:RCC1 domain-containing protein [Actinomycetospora soli]|uniref:RCC1 domain-containing protein n=1 Tax=Actinomycetospora soli TaxID=2893887 RepID=UPI001E54B8A3|nr:hypothetical protein [Actinomycetospora soli]MCD2187882.1 hypothetical protein [Actinomycetospora soli]